MNAEPALQPTSPPRRRRWFQYRLRTLLVVVLLASIGMSWSAVRMQQAKRQRGAVEEIVKSGGVVQYDDWTLRSPQWLRNLLGDDFLGSVVGVGLVSDAQLQYVQQLRHVQELELDGPKVTDAGLDYLKGVTTLRRVSLNLTGITDEGLKRFHQALPNCEIYK